MKIRRVTTGHNAQGKAVFVNDSEVDADTVALMPGAEFHKLWGADQPQRLPDAGAEPPYASYFPPLGGYRFMLFSVPPGAGTHKVSGDKQAMAAEMRATLPGLMEHMERNHPGMHTTDTVDFEYIISGEVWLELDDGQTVHLRAGDTVVQNGTRHAWRNTGTETCQIVVFMVGVPRQPAGLDVARGAAR